MARVEPAFLKLTLTREEAYDLMNFIDAAQVPGEYDKPTVHEICKALAEFIRRDLIGITWPCGCRQLGIDRK